MRRRVTAAATIFVAALAAAGSLACGGGKEEAPAPAPPPVADDSELRALAQRAAAVLGALPATAETPERPLGQARVDLGRLLYYETRLSLDHDLSCNSCHPLDRFGVDNQPTSPGHLGQRGDRNSPSTFNAALQIAQFWDGRAQDVEAQAKGPILNPAEMAMPSEQAVVDLLKSLPDYPEQFAAAFPDSSGDAVSFDHVADAIGAFERGLVTPGPFDDFVAGDYEALSPDARKGLELFMDVGCITCHSGPTVGGGMYQKLGLMEPYETRDTGREKVTGKETDRYFFKVPSLRNVAKTAPYLHDGSVPDLDQMVRIMARHQLGKQLETDQVRPLVAFLDSLTGRVDAAYVARPGDVR